MSKQYIENSESLHYFILGDNLQFSINKTTELNFSINDFDGEWLILKVLIDFIENYQIGDVFTVLRLFDTFN